MGHRLQLVYSSSADLRAHLFEHAQQGAVLLPLTAPPDGLIQYEQVDLEVVVGEARRRMQGEVLQVLPGSGVVVHLTRAQEVAELVQNAPLADPPLPPEVIVVSEDGAAGDASPSAEPADPDAPSEPAAPGVQSGSKPSRGPVIPGSSPVSWSHEQLMAEWPNLSVAERVRVARHGKRPARVMILKGLDKTLHVHVLNNPGLTAEDVTMMAGMANLDPTVLRRIATSTEWLRNTSVARNLVCNPKLNLTLVSRILKYVPADDLRRLTRTGKVRQSVKQAIIKMLDRTR